MLRKCDIYNTSPSSFPHCTTFFSASLQRAMFPKKNHFKSWFSKSPLLLKQTTFCDFFWHLLLLICSQKKGKNTYKSGCNRVTSWDASHRGIDHDTMLGKWCNSSDGFGTIRCSWEVAVQCPEFGEMRCSLLGMAQLNVTRVVHQLQQTKHMFEQIFSVTFLWQ